MAITIYQVLPRLFGNTNAANKPNGTFSENGCGKLADFTPTALKAIKKMGFSHIWYTGVIEHATQTDYSDFGIKPNHPGVIKGMAGSPYAISDYYDIAPDLASEVPNRITEFEQLLARTHQAELQVIIDFVPNHVARQYASDAKPENVTNLGHDDRSDFAFSPLNNFYYIPYQNFTPQFDAKGYSEFPAKATGNDQFTASPGINDWYETVKLNYGVDYQAGKIAHFDPIPDTWEKMYAILHFWAAKNVDGFRCDMAEMVPVEFWAWVIPKIKSVFPKLIFIAEVYNPDEYRNYIFNGKFDYLYDKVGLYDTLRSIISSQGAWATDITTCWQAVQDIQPNMLNFLENHDEQRIASDFFAKDPQKAIPAMLVSGLLNNASLMVYSGQELGERGMDAEGFSGIDGRTTIFDYWSVDTLRTWVAGNCNNKVLTPHQKSLKLFYEKLIQLKMHEKSFGGLSYDLMWVNHQNEAFNPKYHFAFLRKEANDLVLVLVNFEDADADMGVIIPPHAFEFLKLKPCKKAKWRELFSDTILEQGLSYEDLFCVTVPKNNGLVLKLIQ